MAKKQISILVDEDILSAVDEQAERMGRSRNWVFSMWMENWNITSPQCFYYKGDGVKYILTATGWEPFEKNRDSVGGVVSGAGLGDSKKIAEVSARGGGAEGGGTPDLSRLGKAQEFGDLSPDTEVGMTTAELGAMGERVFGKTSRRSVPGAEMPNKAAWPDGVACGHPGCLNHLSHPCEGCGRIGGRAPGEALKFPHWTEEHLRKIAAEEPGGLMACSPEILAMMVEDAKIDAVTAQKLHSAGVKLDREILVRWGLAENYKPKMEDFDRSFPNSLEETFKEEKGDGKVGHAEGRREKGKTGGLAGRASEAVAEGDDGGKSDPVGVGKPGVDMDALRDICAGNIPGGVPLLSPEPVEVDICGFQSYNDVDGENYFCGKEKHGPKIKHGEWIKI